MMFNKINVIYCSNTRDVIGTNNMLQYKIKEDLLYFKDITTNNNLNHLLNYVVMGYNTWLSIGSKPLQNRINIVITKNHKDDFNNKNVFVFSSFEDFIHSKTNLDNMPELFVIGGTQLYEYINKNYNNMIYKVYHTHIFDNTEYCNSLKFKFNLDNYMLMNSNKFTTDNGKVLLEDMTYTNKKLEYCFNVYQNRNTFNNLEEKQYLDIMENILKNNNTKNGRNGEVISEFGQRMEFDLRNGFPLLTTKRVSWKTVLKELLWFINGHTDNKILKDKNVKIWNANASKEFLKSRGLNYEEDDLGPVYGFQWRHFGAKYIDCNTDYTNQGKDQLMYIINEIKKNPNSRRLILNSWNASDIDKMALPPCHVMVQFNIDNEYIDAQLYQRSGDMFLGIPFNISSYAFLLSIIGHLTNYIPRKLIHIIGDAHIYNEHIKSVKIQLKRSPTLFPILKISDKLNDINNIEEEYFTIEKYVCYPTIKAHMIA